MTEAEILAMPAGEQMDQVVSVMMGWKPGFRPSRDIEHAWQVLEKLGLICDLTGPYPASENGWLACFYWHGPQVSRAPTAPLAICRAALLTPLERRKP